MGYGWIDENVFEFSLLYSTDLHFYISSGWILWGRWGRCISVGCRCGASSSITATIAYICRTRTVRRLYRRIRYGVLKNIQQDILIQLDVFKMILVMNDQFSGFAIFNRTITGKYRVSICIMYRSYFWYCILKNVRHKVLELYQTTWLFRFYLRTKWWSISWFNFLYCVPPSSSQCWIKPVVIVGNTWLW